MHEVTEMIKGATKDVGSTSVSNSQGRKRDGSKSATRVGLHQKMAIPFENQVIVTVPPVNNDIVESSIEEGG